MTELKYKTRGNTNPQGKARVYFFCHEKDFDLYFEEITNDILKRQNCAVWYAAEGKCDYSDEHFDRLKEMQLFVMPVTYNLLCTENDVLKCDFTFAIENKIPVLPLIQDEGLVEIFNQKCGDLQYLDKNMTDESAISYDEKLDKYLSSVLIGDELSEKIREAFDAYVFLSYRKKDRKYAQELMRLIHKNEFCRDIAIWYDEYLTPGENFNDSIKDALEKSGLFVLAVTPNLVNEQNYIMTTEYPMAKESGKPILPAELVPTDRQLLAEKYEAIPDCTDARNDAELSVALTDALNKIAIKENDNSPMHNFFIGLAYLGGIDVEVDFDRAVSLITSSAESGLTEAMEKLADMYRNGIGVVRDYDKMIFWQKKKCDVLEKCYDTEDTAEGLVAYLKSAQELVQSYIHSGRAAEGKKYADYAVNKAERAERHIKNTDVVSGLVDLYLSIVQYFINDRKINDAYVYVLKANGLFERNDSENADLTLIKKIISVKSMMGTLENVMGKMSQAIKHGEEALEKWEKIYNGDDSGEIFRVLTSSRLALCGTFIHANELMKARELCEKVIETAESLVQENDDNKNIHLLSSSYHFMAMISEKNSNYDEAEEYYIKALRLRMICYEKYPTVQNLYFLGFYYNNLGNTLRKAKKVERAEEYFCEAAKIAERLYTDYRVTQFILFYAGVVANLSMLKKERHDYSGAEEGLKRGIELYSQAENIEGKGLYAKDKAVAYTRIGTIKYTLKQYSEALDYYFKSVEIYDRLFKESGSKFMQVCLGTVYCCIARVYAAENKCYDAVLFYRKHIEMSEYDVELFKYSGYLPDYLEGCKYIGNIEEKDGDIAAILENFEKYVKAVENNPSYKLNDKQQYAYGYSLFALGKYGTENKVELFSRSLDIVKSLSFRHPDSEFYKKNADVIERWLNKAKNSENTPE